MKFTKLILFNFGPYKGEQSLEFPKEANRNVMLVFGDNMRGKTSILNSLRWVFYEKAINRYGTEIDWIDLLNYEAAREGTHRMWVSLQFTHNGHEFELRREIDALPMVYQPKSSADFNKRVLLKCDGQLVNGDQVETYIEQFLPEQISRFYLFDGELLSEYEMLVMEETEQGRKIRSSIEQVLGVPALVNARDDAKVLLKKAQQAQAQELRNLQNFESLANQSLKLQEEISRLEDDLKTSNEKLAKIKVSVKELDDQLEGWSEIQETVARIHVLKGQMDMLMKQEEELKQNRLAVMKDSWRDLLQPRLNVKRNQVISTISEKTKRIMEIGAVTEDINKYAQILQNDSCPVCEQVVTEEHRNGITTKLKNLQSILELLKQDEGETEDLNGDLTKINRMSGVSSARALRVLETQIKKNAIELTKAETEFANLEESIRGHRSSQIADTKATRDRYVKAQGQVEIRIDETTKQIAEKSATLDHISVLIGSGAGKTSATRQVEIYTALVEVFSKSIEVLRENLREKVAYEATVAFKELTTEKTYSGLQINNNYGLTIIDQFDQPVSMRSAGAEQIVAMSLLSALNKAADRIGPIVIDTPFGRLDPRHRENILRYIPTMAEQIVFLVHAGELDPDSGLVSVADRIGARYEIKRVTSSHSKIERVIR